MKAPTIVLAGTFAFSSVSYADSKEIQKINSSKLPDIYSVGWKEVHRGEDSGDLIIGYINDRELKYVRLLYPIKEKKENGDYYVFEPTLFAEDLNHNGKFEDDEIFEVEYPASCKIPGGRPV